MMRPAILAAGAVALTLLAFLCVPSHLPPPAASKVPTSASFHAHLAQGTLTLRGSLPTESSKSAVLQRAKELYGATPGRVIDELVVDANVGSAAWISSIPKTLPILGHMTERGSIIIDGRSVVISGRIEGDRAKTILLRDIAPLTQAGL